MADTHREPHASSTRQLNALRAAVLGANDGIVSVAGIVVGVAGATSSSGVILAAGLAGLAAGALSMAAGEYVSVSSQRDTEKALLAQEKRELRDYPDEELKELAEMYEKRGLSKKTAKMVAKELSANDPFAAHAEVELKIDPENLNNPWQAAFASAISFLCGAVLPLLTVTLSPANLRVAITFVTVVLALTLTGWLSAKAGGAHRPRAIFRVVFGGVIAMTATYIIGKVVGIQSI